MKQWILRWLGLAPKESSNIYVSPAIIGSHSRQLIDCQPTRNFFEIINAVNGKIVVYNRHQSNMNGPDKNDMEVYLVHEGDDLMATITTAMVSAGLK